MLQPHCIIGLLPLFIKVWQHSSLGIWLQIWKMGFETHPALSLYYFPSLHVTSLLSELPVTKCWGKTLRWASIPLRCQPQNTELLHATETGISSGWQGLFVCVQLWQIIFQFSYTQDFNKESSQVFSFFSNAMFSLYMLESHSTISNCKLLFWFLIRK